MKTVTRWDPFTVLARMDDDFDDLVRRTWGPARVARAGFVPAVDVTVEGPDVVITFELPGVDVDKDIDVQVHEGRLTVSGQRREASEVNDQAGKVLVREMRYGSFRREFALPEGIGADDVEATYDTGLLTVRVRGVRKPAEQPRKITVRTVDVVEGATEPEVGEVADPA